MKTHKQNLKFVYLLLSFALFLIIGIIVSNKEGLRDSTPALLVLLLTELNVLYSIYLNARK